MEQRKFLEKPDGTSREYIFFNVTYNHYRDVERGADCVVRDVEEPAQCECVLCLPKTYSETGAPTPLILSFHGAGGRVCAQDDKIGGLLYTYECVDAGFAVLDVCGSAPHGMTMGCPEHLFAIYKAYRYAIRHYNLEERVMVAGVSMGGQTAMNFVNTFPSIALCVGMYYPRLHMDGVTVDGHYCIGTWDKHTPGKSGRSTHDYLAETYHFTEDTWNEENTIGFNPHRVRSFVDGEGQRVILPPCPIKIWQGTADTTVDPVMVQEYVKAVRRGGCYIELHLLEGVEHTPHPVMRQELTTWFRRFTDL